MAGFIRQINSLRASVEESERVVAVERELDKLYSEGVSALADISNGTDSFGPKANSPIYSRTFLELFGSEAKDVDNIMEGVVNLNGVADSFGLDAAPTPHSCYTMSPQLLKRSSREALKSGFLSYHNQESWEEEALIEKGCGPLYDEYSGRGASTPPVTGTSPLHYFLDTILEEGEMAEANLLFVHNTFTSRESVEYAKERVLNPFWAICPLSNIFIHRALPPLMMMREKELTITLGTDSLSSNDQLSMVEEMKAISRYFPSIELREVIEWATINGARFLGREKELGSIEVGKKPGIVLVDKIDWSGGVKLSKESVARRLV